MVKTQNDTYEYELFGPEKSGRDKTRNMLKAHPEIGIGVGMTGAMLAWRVYSYLYRRKDTTEMFILKSRVMLQAMFVGPLVLVAGGNICRFMYAKYKGEDPYKAVEEGTLLHFGDSKPK